MRINNSTAIYCFIKRLFLINAFTLFIAAPLNAATITVTTFEDQFNNDGQCSLREAVASANDDSAIGGCTAGSGVDSIVLAAGTYTLNRSCNFNDLVAQGSSDFGVECGDLDVNEDLTVTGATKATTIIQIAAPVIDPSILGSDCDLFRAFDVHSQEIEGTSLPVCEGACLPDTSLTLASLTIQGGFDRNGGAVRVSSENDCRAATLITNNVAFNENRADRDGGAVYVKGQYSASGTDFTDNSADSDGGGAYIDWNKSCPLSSTVLTSAFTGNFAYEGNGGAIFLGNNTDADIGNSTFTGNNARQTGGAISASVTNLNITGSTITGNGVPVIMEVENGYYPSSPILGGGVFVGRADGRFLIPLGEYSQSGGESTVLIANTTITANEAVFGGGGIATVDGRIIRQAEATGGSSCEPIVVNANLRDSTISGNKVGQNFFLLNGQDAFPYLYSAFAGGGIVNSILGKFVVETSTIDSNTAALGAGIYNESQLQVVKSAVTNNISRVNSALVPAGTSAQIDQDPFLYTINFSGGGGIGNAGAADVENTTISGNTTDGSGAGVLNALSEIYASLYSNSQEQQPVSNGVELPQLEFAEPGTRLNNCTVATNSIVEVETPIYVPLSVNNGQVATYLNNGGGIATLFGSMTLSNTIVATNNDTQELLSEGDLFPQPTPPPSFTPDATNSGSGVSTAAADPAAVALFGNFAPDCYVFPSGSVCDEANFCDLFLPQIISAQYNLIGTNQGCSAFDPAENSNNDIVGTEASPVDPLLNLLGNNGGNTLSHLPKQGSPVLDAANPDAVAPVSIAAIAAKPCAGQDQTSASRALDADLNGVAVCDIGSLEAVVDCGGLPGGNKVPDVCGVCGGDGSSCAPIPTPQAVTCQEQNIQPTLLSMDGNSQTLSRLTRSIGQQLKNNGGSKKLAQSSFTESEKLHNAAWQVTWGIPGVIKSNCTGDLAACVSVSTTASTSQYNDLVGQINAINQNLLKSLKKTRAKKSLVKKLQKRNDATFAAALSASGAVPPASTNCP